MRAYYLLLCLFALTLNSCKSETKCDCERDCPKPKNQSDIIVLNPEDYITLEQFYAHYLSNEEAKKQLAKKMASGKKKEDLRKEIDIDLSRLRQEIELTGIEPPKGCDICPGQEKECCFIVPKFVLVDLNFSKIKLLNSLVNPINPKNKDFLLYPIDSIKGYDTNQKRLNMNVLNLDGKLVDFEVHFKK